MKITFITHSCYFVELESCCLLFDYYEGEIPSSAKPLFAFASHRHGDHFSPALFQALEGRQPVTFILSDDIYPSRVPEHLREQTLFAGPHETLETGPLKIATLESTDVGVAFLVQCEGRLIYHAGDLNCWVWDGAPRLQNDQMTARYRRELQLLPDQDIDVAFVPLDPRQEADFDLGMKYFLETARARAVFPMHMWGDYSVIPLFKSTPGYEKYAGCIMDVQAPGQVFELPESTL